LTALTALLVTTLTTLLVTTLGLTATLLVATLAALTALLVTALAALLVAALTALLVAALGTLLIATLCAGPGGFLHCEVPDQRERVPVAVVGLVHHEPDNRQAAEPQQWHDRGEQTEPGCAPAAESHRRREDAENDTQHEVPGDEQDVEQDALEPVELGKLAVVFDEIDDETAEPPEQVRQRAGRVVVEAAALLVAAATLLVATATALLVAALAALLVAALWLAPPAGLATLGPLTARLPASLATLWLALAASVSGTLVAGLTTLRLSLATVPCLSALIRFVPRIVRIIVV